MVRWKHPSEPLEASLLSPSLDRSLRSVFSEALFFPPEAELRYLILPAPSRVSYDGRGS
ncbi:unnamed protein product [Musa acuminata subsp. burmannicoides]